MKLRLIPVLTVLLLGPQRSPAGDFEALFEGRGGAAVSVYLNPDSTYLADITLGAAIDLFRIDNHFLNLHLSKETALGKNAHGFEIMHPDRGDYSFGLTWRIELPRHFLELHYHHDSFHSIDKWEEQSIYWNSPRLAFGSTGYLPGRAPSISKLDYLFQANFYAPRGLSWQKRHGYDFSLNTNVRYEPIRAGRFAVGLESANLWVVNSRGGLDRQHAINAGLKLRTSRGVLEIFGGWWPYDDQFVRNRSGKSAIGIRVNLR